jgi:hypothetical protein
MIDRNEEVATALRELIAAVVIHPKDGAPEIEVTGRLAKLTGSEVFPQQVIPPTVVAGAGFEPATSGL